MKRTLGLILTGVAVAGAFVLPQPDPEPGPDFVGPEIRESVAAATASVWYCPWVASGALRDSTVMLAATVPVEGKLTLPQQIPGEAPDVEDVSLDDAGALVVAVGEIVRRGDTPVFVEFGDGPAAAAAVVASAELLTGDSCVARIPKVWELPGGTTREGRTLTLRLFNPFPELAKISVSGSSESGETGLVDLQNLDVPGRTWHDVNLNAIVPLLDDLSLKVTSSEGFVIPSLVVGGTTDEASWPGTAPATNWEFPVATISSEFAPSLMLSNTAAAPLNVFIDVYTDQGVTVNAREVEVLPSIPSRVDLGDLADGALGIRVRATAPVAAAVIAEESVAVLAPSDEEGQVDEVAEEGGDRIAGTIGINAPATEWLLPGLRAVVEGDSTLWLLNTGTEAATITLQPLGVRDLTAAKVVVPPGSLLGVPLGYDVTVGGYLLESSSPVSVAWSVESPAGLMFVTGTVVGG
ncbi:MAG: DUF5719 family protein [Actinomycetota bacterium]|nr:DUF5719 family protein [Actinomycetota bacterium]